MVTLFKVWVVSTLRSGIDGVSVKTRVVGNDFEKIITRTNEEITQILNFFKDLEYVIFSRMTGTGSCCYAAFDKKKDADNAQKIFVKKFPLLWTLITENNAINR